LLKSKEFVKTPFYLFQQFLSGRAGDFKESAQDHLRMKISKIRCALVDNFLFYDCLYFIDSHVTGLTNQLGLCHSCMAVTKGFSILNHTSCNWDFSKSQRKQRLLLVSALLKTRERLLMIQKESPMPTMLSRQLKF
jgi:hypothetical protein